MNVLLSVIIATLVIAAMIAIRILVFQRALEERLKAGRSGSACDTSCFHDCDTGKSEPGDGRVTRRNKHKRSASHAS